MNYLSHHFVARQIAPNADSFYFAGNVIPDLLAHDGEGRLRERHIEGDDSSFALGVGLHLATDKRFHSSPAFKDACGEAAELIRAAPLSETPRRVFFLAHVFVEIALDGWVIAQNPGIADDLYTHLENCGISPLCAATAALLGVPGPLPHLENSLTWFLGRRYLSEYAAFDGLAEALHRIGVRAALPGFPAASDRAALAAAFAAFAPRLPASQLLGN